MPFTAPVYNLRDIWRSFDEDHDSWKSNPMVLDVLKASGIEHFTVLKGDQSGKATDGKPSPLHYYVSEIYKTITFDVDWLDDTGLTVFARSYLLRINFGGRFGRVNRVECAVSLERIGGAVWVTLTRKGVSVIWNQEVEEWDGFDAALVGLNEMREWIAAMKQVNEVN